MKVKETQLISCRKCGQKVVLKTSKRGRKVLVDVQQDCTGLTAVTKNGLIIEHRC